MINWIIILFSVFFAINMGGVNFSSSFAAAYGSGVLSKRISQILFIIFVVLGALVLGNPVIETISHKVIPQDIFTLRELVFVIISASVSLFMANILRLPQSTSIVTVGAILGVGLFFKSVYTKTLVYLVSFWIVLPVLSYFLTHYLTKLIYPPHRGNFWIYEKLFNHHKRLRLFIIIASCYNAFSIGTNNVANVVGPLVGAGFMDKLYGLIIFSPIFGLGCVFFHSNIRHTGEKIVPLGVITATIICFVTATLLIIASVLGVPQSFVTIKLASIFAVSSLKNGHRMTFNNPFTRKTYFSWIIIPSVAVCLSYILTYIFFKRG